MMWHVYDGWSWGYGMMGAGWVLMVLFWGLVILFIVAFARWLSRSSGAATGKPLDILKERYAKGEITRDEFSQMKRDLGG